MRSIAALLALAISSVVLPVQHLLETGGFGDALRASSPDKNSRPGTKRVKVLHVISGLSVGGAEMMLYKLLSNTDQERFEPVVISLTDRGTLGDGIESLEVPLYTIGMKPGVPTPFAVWRLIRLARRLKPDLIQGWMTHGNLAAQLVATFVPKRVPVFWNARRSLYSLDHEKPMNAVIIKLGAQLSRLPVKIIYNSKVGAAQHESFGYRADKTLVVPNGFDTGLFTPSKEARDSVRRELGVAENTVLIGLIGRYSPMKDHANFLRAAASLLKSHPDVHFVLSGKGVVWQNRVLEELVHGLGIAERVHLLGERHDMPRLTAALDIASSSSAYDEGFSNVVGEAMSCGVPCVVTDVGDSAWVVGETGRVVPPQNSEALCAAWRELLEMKTAARHELGMRARQRVKEQFSIEKIVRQYEKIYREQSYGINLDREIIEGFGDEWSRFDQSGLSQRDREDMFDAYFSIFPWHALPEGAVGFDLGCGSGRWAMLVAPRIGELHCIDPSAAALDVAKRNLKDQQNCRFHLAGVENIPLEDGSADFGYALGVLHHVPDTGAGIKTCVSKLKKGAPFLLYLYYKFDNRPWWFRSMWRTSELGRFLISRTPYPVRYLLSQIIALTVYLPLSRFSLLLEKLGFDVDSVPLSFYRNKGFYVLRTDALDRFGTKLEKRFAKDEIGRMMERAGLERITFSDHAPYWSALGYKE